MNRYLGAFLFILAVYLITPLATIVFNYSIDPFERYHAGVRAEDMARLLKSADLLLQVPSNYEDRLLMKKFLQVREKPAFAVLGGSRIMNIHEGLLRGEYRSGFLNAGVSAGTVSDYVSIWKAMKRERKIPGILYLEIDAQAIYSNFNGNFSWSTFAPDYFAFKLEKGGKKSLKRAWKSVRRLFFFHLQRLTSWEWTAKSLEKKNLNRTPFVLIQNMARNPDVPARTPGFALLYPRASSPLSHEFLEEWGKKNGDYEVRYLADWGSMSDHAFSELSDLISDIAKHGVRLVVVIPPSHPFSYRTVASSSIAFPNMLRFIEAVRVMSEEAGASFFDGLHENRHLVDGMDFVDGVHVNPETNARVMAAAGKAAGLDLFVSENPDRRNPAARL